MFMNISTFVGSDSQDVSCLFDKTAVYFSITYSFLS